MSRKDSFIVYTSYHKQISRLNDEQRGKLLTAMMEFAINGEASSVDMDDVTEMAFEFISDQMRRDAAAYADKCATNKSNGSKGGRPPKGVKPNGSDSSNQKPNGLENNQSQPNGFFENPYEYDYEYDDEYESDSDNDSKDMSEAKPSDSSPTVIELELNDKSLYPITETQVAEFVDLYPAVDVMQELRAMKGWLLHNPKKRKTKAGVMRFVNGWLAREQDRGGSKINGGTNNEFRPSTGFRRAADSG